MPDRLWSTRDNNAAREAEERATGKPAKTIEQARLELDKDGRDANTKYYANAKALSAGEGAGEEAPPEEPIGPANAPAPEIDLTEMENEPDELPGDLGIEGANPALYDTLCEAGYALKPEKKSGASTFAKDVAAYAKAAPVGEPRLPPGPPPNAKAAALAAKHAEMKARAKARADMKAARLAKEEAEKPLVGQEQAKELKAAMPAVPTGWRDLEAEPLFYCKQLTLSQPEGRIALMEALIKDGVVIYQPYSSCTSITQRVHCFCSARSFFTAPHPRKEAALANPKLAGPINGYLPKLFDVPAPAEEEEDEPATAELAEEAEGEGAAAGGPPPSKRRLPEAVRACVAAKSGQPDTEHFEVRASIIDKPSLAFHGLPWPPLPSLACL